MTSKNPILYLGVDIGVSRDTAAIAAVYPYDGKLHLWGHKIVVPTPDKRVNIHHEITDTLLSILEKERVAQIMYDPYQFISESQRLVDMGYGRLMREVNQQTENTVFSNTLETHLTNGTLVMYKDMEIRNHFLWCVAKEGERGIRIVKRKQTKPIDFVVSLGMALYGATTEEGHLYHPSFNESIHSKPLEAMP